MKKLLFSPKGRINRAKYIWSNIGVNIVAAILFIIVNLLFTFLIADSIEDESSAAGTYGVALLAINIIIQVILSYISIILGVKRCHDLDKSGWFLLLAIIPFVNIYVAILLVFIKGTDGNNRFGKNPLAQN